LFKNVEQSKPLKSKGKGLKSLPFKECNNGGTNGGPTTFILLIASTESESTVEAVRGLAEAALARGHGVTAFFNEGSVGLLKRSGEKGGSRLFPAGLQLLACRTSAATHGLTSLDDMVDGAEMSSLGELVDLMTDSDRVLFVG